MLLQGPEPDIGPVVGISDVQAAIAELYAGVGEFIRSTALFQVKKSGPGGAVDAAVVVRKRGFLRPAPAFPVQKLLSF